MRAEDLAPSPSGSSLTEFVAGAAELSDDERRRIIDQALLLVDQLYVHLPLKRAMYAVDPVQRLKLLRYHAARLSEREFHDELMSLFAALHDLHTLYLLPVPYQRRAAVLPFLIARCFVGDRPQYVVKALTFGFSHAQFKRGVEVTHWNGTPIARALEIAAGLIGGSNPAARHARAVASLTTRPMALLAPPSEE